MKDQKYMPKGEMAHVERNRETRMMQVRFNGEYSPTELEDQYVHNGSTGWTAPGVASIEGTMTHELGHAIDMWLEDTVKDYDNGDLVMDWLSEYYKGQHSDFDMFDKDLIKSMKKEASEYSFGFMTLDYDNGPETKEVIDFSEFLAEAWADGEINGKKAWKLSQFVHSKIWEMAQANAK